MAQNDVVAWPRHPRERLPTIAPQILDSVPKVNLQVGRFFVLDDEFELRINEIAFQLWKIQYFAKFVNDNKHGVKERHLILDDVIVFADFLSVFLNKEFVDRKDTFRKICRHFPFEFLIMLDLCREQKDDFEDSYVSLLQARISSCRPYLYQKIDSFSL